MSEQRADNFLRGAEKRAAARPLPESLKDKFSLEVDETDPELATITCNKCPDQWDLRLPMNRGAHNMLENHWHWRHDDARQLRKGEIRKRGFRDRMERKVDNVLACVSYLPGLRPVDGGDGRSGRPLLEEEVQDAGDDTSNHGGQEALPIEVSHCARNGGRE